MQTPGDGLQIDVSHLDGHAVLAIRGEIDLATAPAFGAAIDQALRGRSDWSSWISRA